jgi:hypothetical protein
VRAHAATRSSSIYGPFKHGSRWRVVIVAADGTRTHAREGESGPGGFATRQAAEAYIDAFRDEANDRTIGIARDELHRHSIVSASVKAVICGLGTYGYIRGDAGGGADAQGAAQAMPAAMRDGPAQRARSSRPGRRWIYWARGRRAAGVPSTNRSAPCTSS